MVLMVGVDVHKDTHTAVLVDELGRRQAARTVKATDAGHPLLLAWVAGQAPGRELCWAVEDCRHVSTRLERALLGTAQRVLRVPPKLMAGARPSARPAASPTPAEVVGERGHVLGELVATGCRGPWVALGRPSDP